jgi:glycosyltransferase involved in cell wall biosynthesis
MDVAPRAGIDVLVHDFAGHPFEAELSRELARTGLRVVHAHCGGVTTGKGNLQRTDDDPVGLSFLDVSDVPFERYSALGRARSEYHYGRRLAAVARELRPRCVISANTPLIAQASLWWTCRRLGVERIFWLQDFLGRGVRAVFTERNALLGATVGRAIERLETALLRGSDGIIVIADDFLSALRDRRVDVPTLVVENWAPLDEIRMGVRPNPWSSSMGLDGMRVAIYSGTLGLKHDPEHLVVAAAALDPTTERLVVITEGLGREHLERAKEAGDLTALMLCDFVPYETLSDVLSTADVCIVLLEEDAGTFSVPSKVLSYLAAGRAIVGAMPAANLATRTIARAGAGVVVDPGSYEQFAASVCSLLRDRAAADRMGRDARSYAESAFDAAGIAARVIGFVDAVRSGSV